MHRFTPVLFALVAIGCLSNNTGGDAGIVDGGSDAGQIDSGGDSGVDGGPDGGEPGSPALSCDVPAGGDADDVELVQAWSAFVADESHFSCAQDGDCVVVNYRENGGDDGDWCGCIGGGLTSKWGIAVNAASAEEAEAMTERGLSDDCQELRELVNEAICDGNPPIGAICVDNRCAQAFDPDGGCGMNGGGDAGPG